MRTSINIAWLMNKPLILAVALAILFSSLVTSPRGIHILYMMLSLVSLIPLVYFCESKFLKSEMLLIPTSGQYNLQKTLKLTSAMLLRDFGSVRNPGESCEVRVHKKSLSGCYKHRFFEANYRIKERNGNLIVSVQETFWFPYSIYISNKIYSAIERELRRHGYKKA